MDWRERIVSLTIIADALPSSTDLAGLHRTHMHAEMRKAPG
jgi:hypothetical protein